jgi:PAS domain S-box-containing protein
MIISDILMPKMDGFELCRRCKANETLQNIPFIFYTAMYTDSKDEQFALSLGANRFITKPQQTETLAKIIQEVLNEPVNEDLASRRKPSGDKAEILQQYNEVLFHKLEQKVSELEAEVEKQKKTENMLRESEERYHSIFENSDDAIFLTSPDGTIINANPAACRMFGYSEAEFIRLGRSGITNLDDPRLSDALEERKRTGRFSGELTFLRRDGQIFSGELSSILFKDKNGQIKTSLIIRDITERKNAEIETKRLNQILQTVREVNKLIANIEFENELLQKICAVLVEGRSYKLARIGFIKEGNYEIQPVAQEGFAQSYITSLKFTWDNSQYGRSPSGTAIKTGKPAVVFDVATDESYKLWRDEASKYGIMSVAALPLIIQDKIIGALVVYSDKSDVFNEDEMDLLADMAGDISLGINKIAGSNPDCRGKICHSG